ncbi:hypothetical protein D3C83_107130 [compost metagenome]
MIMWSVRESNIGSITFSRHCRERFDAVTEPSVSNCVAAGRRYAPSLRTLANIAAVADGYGSMTTRRSSFFIASSISRPRLCELGEWPQ